MREPGLIEPYIGRAVKFETQAFTALNTALASDGAVVVVPNDTVVDKPIHLLYLTESADAIAAHPRTLIVVGRHGQAHVVTEWRMFAAWSTLVNVRLVPCLTRGGAPSSPDRLMSPGM